MTTKQFKIFFENLDKKEFEDFWRTNNATETAKKYNLHDYREAKKVADLLGIIRTEEEILKLKADFAKKCSRPGEQNGMYGKSAMKGRKHTKEAREKMSKNHSNFTVMHKNNIVKHVKQNDVDMYLEIGWVLGDTGEHNKNRALATQKYWEDNFGVTNPFVLPEIKEKILKTTIEKYGVDNISKLQEIKDKKAETMFNNYGRYHLNTRYEYNNVKFDSSWELMYYIYLVDSNIEFEYQPNVKFYYLIDNEQHFYCPDFKVNDKYIEIKGDQFFDKDGNMYNPYSDFQDKTKAKYDCMVKNDIMILRHSDLKDIFSEVEQKYGKNFYENYKII